LDILTVRFATGSMRKKITIGCIGGNQDHDIRQPG